jgi:hypothetical protein
LRAPSSKKLFNCKVVAAEKASLTVGTLTIIGTIVGGGVVGIPYATL